MTNSMIFYLLWIFVSVRLAIGDHEIYGKSLESEISVRQKRTSVPFCPLDKFKVFVDHTMCLPSPHTYLNKSDVTEIVNIHNHIRQHVSPVAGDMLEMHYLPPLEREAQRWADNCALRHDGLMQRYMPGRYTVGQNIATSTSKISWSDVINKWAYQNQSFQYDSQNNNVTLVKEYIQLVWAQTNVVGCGYANCSGTHFYVCNYAPKPNFDDIARPYEESASKTKCSLCQGHCNTNNTLNMCDCNDKFCLNGAKLNLTTCKCDCNQDVQTYFGEFCELNCTKNGDNPKCGTSPWNKTACLTEPEALINCPWMCNICPFSGANYSDGSVSVPTLTPPTTSTMPTTPVGSFGHALGHTTNAHNLGHRTTASTGAGGSTASSVREPNLKFNLAALTILCLSLTT